MRDNELDNFIQKTLEESPNMGEKILQGASGIRIQRRRLRSSTEMVEPIGKVLRGLRTLRRRKY